MGLRAQRSRPVSGVNTLIGQTAETISPLNLQGHVKISGETWNAISLSGKINENEKVIVKEIKGLTLYVASQDASAPLNQTKI